MRYTLPPIPPATADGRKRRPMTKLTPKQQSLYLGHLAMCGLVVLSATAVGVSRQSIVRLRDRDEAFKSDEEEAMDEFRERLEAEALRRGFAGYDEPLSHQGNLTGHVVTKFDSGLAALVLKRQIPAYRDKITADVNVRAGVMLAPGTMDAAAWVAAFGGDNDGQGAKQ